MSIIQRVGVVDGWRCSNYRWSYDAKRAFGKYDLPLDIRTRASKSSSNTFVRSILADSEHVAAHPLAEWRARVEALEFIGERM